MPWARLLIVVATAWLFFFWLDLVFALWLKEEQEMTVWHLRLFEPPWSWLFLVFHRLLVHHPGAVMDVPAR